MSLNKKLNCEYQKGYDEGYKKGLVDGEMQGIEYEKNKSEQCEEYVRERVINCIKNNFKKKNGKLIGCCPFHREETPSCVYDPIEDEFFCLSCGENGNGWKLVKELEDIQPFVIAIPVRGNNNDESKQG